MVARQGKLARAESDGLQIDDRLTTSAAIAGRFEFWAIMITVVLRPVDLQQHDLSQNHGTRIATAALAVNRRTAVSRFYFHTETDVRTTDDEGMEFPGYAEARREAIRTCGQMMQDAPEVFWGSRPWNVSVTNADGLILWEIYVDGQTSAAGRSLEPERNTLGPPGIITDD